MFPMTIYDVELIEVAILIVTQWNFRYSLELPFQLVLSGLFVVLIGVTIPNDTGTFIFKRMCLI